MKEDKHGWQKCFSGNNGITFGLFVAAVFLAAVALCAVLAVYFNSTNLPFLGQFFAPQMVTVTSLPLIYARYFTAAALYKTPLGAKALSQLPSLGPNLCDLAAAHDSFPAATAGAVAGGPASSSALRRRAYA